MARLNQKQLDEAHKKLNNDARKRVAERGVLQFRADADTILSVMEAADKAKKPVGTLLREWVQEKLMLESAQHKAPDLIERVSILEQVVSDLRQRLQ